MSIEREILRDIARIAEGARAILHGKLPETITPGEIGKVQGRLDVIAATAGEWGSRDAAERRPAPPSTEAKLDPISATGGRAEGGA